MACTPLDIQPGFFQMDAHWETTPSKIFDGKTLTVVSSGPNPGIHVEQGSHHLVAIQSINWKQSYMVLGGKYLLVLDEKTGDHPYHRQVSVADFSSWCFHNILSITAETPDVPLPEVQASQGNGTAFLAYGYTLSGKTGAGIWQSDSGKPLCSPDERYLFHTGAIKGEATECVVIIHYYLENGELESETSGPLPTGHCKITPSSKTFSGVFVGGGPFTPPTGNFKIKNVGTDCMIVKSVRRKPPFFVQSPTFPKSLAPNQTLTLTVAFIPSTPGSWNSVKLHVSTTPAIGADTLVCSGKAEPAPAVFRIKFNATSFNFGPCLVGAFAQNKTLTITNSGSRPLAVKVPRLNIEGFSCAAYHETLNGGQGHNISLSFKPRSVGPHSATLNVISDAPGSPHSISLSGKGIR